MNPMRKHCELWKDLTITYGKLKYRCCCSLNEDEIKKTIQRSFELTDSSEENQLDICLLGLSTISLLGKITWQQNHQEICMKLELLSKYIVSNDIIHKMAEILLTCHNKHILYNIRKCMVAFLFYYPKEISIEVENYLLSFLVQPLSERKPSYEVLEMLLEIVMFQRPQNQPIYSYSTDELMSNCKHHHKYNVDDRSNEIKSNFTKAGICIWNDLLLCLKDKSSSDELQFTILDIWSCLIVMALHFQLSLKEILGERSLKKILDVSFQFSSSICAKVFIALNQILSLNYLQGMQTLPSEIIHLSQDIVMMTKNGWLENISLKTKCNNFIGEQASNSGSEEVCLIHLRNVILIILKSLSIIIKCDEQITTEDTFLVLNGLKKWLQNRWNKNKDLCTDEESLIEFFLDQDDQLLEMMICNLDIYIHLQRVPRCGVFSETGVMQTFNPHMLFLHFIQQVDYDYSLFLDLLTSNESCVLLFLLKYLKLVKYEWHNFIFAHQVISQRSQIDFENILPKCNGKRVKLDLYTCKLSDEANNDNENTVSSKSFGIVNNSWPSSVHATIEMLMQLCSKIQNLQGKGLFPYNARPLVRILNECKRLYNCNETT